MSAAALVCSLIAVGPAVAGRPAGAATSATDWAAYENGPLHTSDHLADGSISPAAVPTLHARWSFHADPRTTTGQPGPAFDASPAIAGGVVYIGSRTGIFTALRVSDGSVLWRDHLDYGSNTVCPAKGTTGTASVAADPVTGKQTVYAPGAHYLYALDAATGAINWKTAIGPDTAAGEAQWYNWSSPTVSGGKIYMGLASNCDASKVRGGEVQLNQHTGAVLHTWYAVPAGVIGPSVWSSASATSSAVWVTTGNPDPSASGVYDAVSIVRLSPSTMAEQDKWTEPYAVDEDLDFGSSPTMFTVNINGKSTVLAGACNKNGVYYAWRAFALSAGPIWHDQVSVSNNSAGACITSAAYDTSAKRLFIAANQTTLNAQTVPGAVRAVDAATGTILWSEPLPCSAAGSPTLNGATHVLAVPLYNCPGSAAPGVALFDSRTGTPLRTLGTTDAVFAQPVFAAGYLFVADEDGTLTEYGLRGT